MNRHRFLLTSAAGTAVLALPWIPGPPVLAQGVGADLGLKIADKIGDHLLDTVLTKGADAIGLGGVMSFLGMGDSATDNGEVLAKLDTIQQELAQIGAAVAALQSDMERQFAQTDYDVVIGGAIQSLIDKNESLTDDFRTLLGMRGDTSGLRADMASKMSGDFLDCLAAWNNAMTGSHGTTSLIAGWSKVVASSGPFFNRAMAARIQQQWAYFDAQQALSVTYLIEHYNATRQKSRVRPVLDAWMRNRQHQLTLLRGTFETSDTFPAIGADGRKTVQTTRLRALPPNTIVDHKNLLMWYLAVGPYVPQGSETVDFDCPEPGSTIQPQQGAQDAASIAFTDLTVDTSKAVARATGVGMWQLPGSDDFEKMIAAAGGVAGTQNDAFMMAMEAAGFTFPLGLTREQWSIWAFASPSGIERLHPDCNSGTHRHQQIFYGNAQFNDGGALTTPAGDPTTSAMIIYKRGLEQGEAYFY